MSRPGAEPSQAHVLENLNKTKFQPGLKFRWAALVCSQGFLANKAQILQTHIIQDNKISGKVIRYYPKMLSRTKKQNKNEAAIRFLKVTSSRRNVCLWVKEWLLYKISQNIYGRSRRETLSQLGHHGPCTLAGQSLSRHFHSICTALLQVSAELPHPSPKLSAWIHSH